jgi:hypothetical protein
VSVATILVVFGASSPTFAATKNGGGTKGGGSTSTLSVVNETAPGTTPAFGQTVTFQVSTTATTKPYVGLKCTQNSVEVYSTSAGFFVGYPWPWQQNMTLSSGAWTGGAASCVATLYYYLGNGKFSTLATLDFAVRA